MLELDPHQYPPSYEFDVDQLNFPTEGLCFVGLVSLMDPPKETVPAAVSACKCLQIQGFAIVYFNLTSNCIHTYTLSTLISHYLLVIAG